MTGKSNSEELILTDFCKSEKNDYPEERGKFSSGIKKGSGDYYDVSTRFFFFVIAMSSSFFCGEGEVAGLNIVGR